MAVTRLDIRSRSPFFEGAYERLEGAISFAVDPGLAANQAICDIDKAPRDAGGLIEFSADFCLLQPADPARGNRTLLTEVVNRGRRGLMTRFNRAPETAPDVIHPGDGCLFRHGFALASVGWQWDVITGNGLMGFAAPAAVDASGRELGAQVVVEIQTNAHQADALLANRVHKPYVVADVNEAAATMTVRDYPDGPRTTIARDRWQFARNQEGRPAPANTHVWLAGGFEPGRIYEVTYRSAISPVVGAGLLAYRDTTSFLRYGGAGEGNPAAGRVDHALGYGASQSGRFLRHFLYLGLNADEAGRIVYDGLLPHIAGARRGEYNHRGGQPSVQSTASPSVLMPFSFDDQTDAATGKTDGLLRRQRGDGGMPKVIATNTSAEYWRGDASMIHTDIEGRKDVTPPDNVRVYHFSGTQHGSGAVPLADVNALDGAHGAHSFNTVDYGPLLRAALLNLLAWVRDGKAPPPNVTPRLDDGTAVPASLVVPAFKRLPGVTAPDPEKMPHMRRLDYGPEAAAGVMAYPPKMGEAYPSFVSAVDADGNEVGGIRLPDIAVPLATYTGWNPRHPSTGGPGQILAMLGSTLPFAPTRAARQAADDPRPSIEERYASKEAFLGRVRSAAAELVSRGLLLQEDLELVVETNARKWDYFVNLRR